MVRNEWLEVARDPFVWFCLFVLISPPLLGGLSLGEIIQYFFHPAMVLTFLTVAAAYYDARRSNAATVHLTPIERQVARWWLLNGVIIHIAMDGLVGVYKVNAPLAATYARVDTRYAAPLGSEHGAAVHVVSLVELYVMGPVCMWLYRCYHRGSPERDIVEVLAAALQIFGTVIYAGTEAITGGIGFFVDRDFLFSMDHIVYFWFAVVFSCLLWIVLPGYCGVLAFCRLRKRLGQSEVKFNGESQPSRSSSRSPARRSKKN